MRSVTQIKSLADMRTTVSTHVRSAPRREGSNHIEIYLLDRERQRLETELARLSQRRRRIEGRLQEIQGAMEKLIGQAQQGESLGPRSPTSADDENQMPEDQKWTSMTVEY